MSTTPRMLAAGSHSPARHQADGLTGEPARGHQRFELVSPHEAGLAEWRGARSLTPKGAPSRGIVSICEILSTVSPPKSSLYGIDAS